MADLRISELTELTAPAGGDHLAVVDISDTTMAASGTTKKLPWSEVTDYADTGDTNTLTAAQVYADGPLTVQSDKTTNYTFVLGDAGQVIPFNLGSALTATVPLDSAAAFPIGTVIRAIRRGAGALNLAATGGVTLRSPFGTAVSVQYGSVEFLKIATNEWIASCD
jgi:hypothetical protein